MVGLLGSGSWASAIVKILLEHQDLHLNWWVREPEIRETLATEHHNPLYLSEAYIDTSRVNVSGDIEEVIKKSHDIILVIPSAFIHKAFKDLPKDLLKGKNFHSAVKGIVPETNQIVTEYLHSEFDIPYENLSFFAGPSHAEETAKQRLTYLTVASSNPILVEEMRERLSCHYVKTTASTDMQGMEYSTVLKNIYAIAAGICRGMGYGDNLVAVLISNAMQEMDNFIQHLVPMESRQLEQFAYLGDLLVTAYSQFSRNRTFGNMIGYGYSVKGAQLEMKMVAEGYYAVNCVEKMRKEFQISMPILQAVYKVLYENALPTEEVKSVIENLK